MYKEAKFPKKNKICLHDYQEGKSTPKEEKEETALNLDGKFPKDFSTPGFQKTTSALNANPLTQEIHSSIMHQKSSPSGLVLEFEIWGQFDTKQKSKSFTVCHCV